MATEFVARGADLELKGIRKEFPGFVAIENLDLHIPAGEFFALLGPSGCGKTTTLRLVAGLEEPTAGQILIGGKDVTHTKAHERPVNTVFQSYALFPHMSVLENVAFGLKQRKIEDPMTKAQAALDMVELGHLSARRPQQLSGGQQQRVALARGLAFRPLCRSALHWRVLSGAPNRPKLIREFLRRLRFIRTRLPTIKIKALWMTQ